MPRLALHADRALLLVVRTVRILREHERTRGVERVEDIEVEIVGLDLVEVERAFRLAPAFAHTDRRHAVAARLHHQGVDDLCPAELADRVPRVAELLDDPVFAVDGDGDDTLLRLRSPNRRRGEHEPERMIRKDCLAHLVAGGRAGDD